MTTTTPFARKLLIPAGLLGALIFAIGAPWDQQIHVHQGHTPLALAHLVIASGLFIYIICGLFSLLLLWGGRSPLKERNTLKLIAFGGLALPFEFALDEAWHSVFGIDITAWSPPHIAILWSTIIVLFALASLEANYAKQKHSARFSWSTIRLVLFFAAIFFVALFFFIDFDVPSMAQIITSTRPALSYSVTLTGTIVFLSLLAAHVSRRAGVVTIAALIAWGHYMAMGMALDVIHFSGEDLHKILPPFPVVLPALAADASFFLLRKYGTPLSVYSLLGAAFFTGSLSYIGVVMWVELFAQLPQQGFEANMLWIAWYPAAVIISLCAGAAAFLLARCTLGEMHNRNLSTSTVC